MEKKTIANVFEAFMQYTWDGYDDAEANARFSFVPHDYDDAVEIAETLGGACAREWRDEYDTSHRDYEFPDGSHSIVIMSPQDDGTGSGFVG